jgi:hypothetical protein
LIFLPGPITESLSIRETNAKKPIKDVAVTASFPRLLESQSYVEMSKTVLAALLAIEMVLKMSISSHPFFKYFFM